MFTAHKTRRMGFIRLWMYFENLIKGWFGYVLNGDVRSEVVRGIGFNLWVAPLSQWMP